jgi:RNA polymerase sigma-70 factor (ECF subfamily)
MLGSFADAEDAVQETMLAAWQGIGGFAEERAPRSEPAPGQGVGRVAVRTPLPTPRDEAVWLQNHATVMPPRTPPSRAQRRRQ